MSNNIVKARLILRNDTQTEWEQNNPILLQGQPGYSVTDGILKIGDGITPWCALAVAGGSGGITPPIATSNTIGGVLSSNAPNGVTVKQDGTMTINSVATRLLYLIQGDELTLNGGNS